MASVAPCLRSFSNRSRQLHLGSVRRRAEVRGETPCFWEWRKGAPESSGCPAFWRTVHAQKRHLPHAEGPRITRLGPRSGLINCASGQMHNVNKRLMNVACSLATPCETVSLVSLAVHPPTPRHPENARHGASRADAFSGCRVARVT